MSHVLKFTELTDKTEQMTDHYDKPELGLHDALVPELVNFINAGSKNKK